MKKKLILIVVIIAVIMIIFLVKSKNIRSKYDYEITQVNEYNYFISSETSGFGVIDKNGKNIIESKYKEVIIPNPQVDIFVCNDGQKEVIFNSNGEQLFTNYDSVSPIKLKNIASALNYEKNTLIYEKNGKYGLMDFDGKEITKNSYDSIGNLQPTEGKFIVSINNKYGVIDLKGNQIIDTKYDSVLVDGYYTEEYGYKRSGFIVSNTEDEGYKYGYIDYTGKKILDVKYNDIKRISKEDDKNIYLIVCDNGKYGLYNNSKQIIQNEYQGINYDENLDILLIQKNKKYGAMDLEGKTLVEIKNNQIEVNGIYIYTEDKVYDNKGNKVDIYYDRTIYKTENEEYLITSTKTDGVNKYGIMNKDNTQLVDENYSYIEYLFDNYFIATNSNGKMEVINSNGKIMLEAESCSLQKIKGTKILQVIKSNSKENDFYDKQLNKIDTLENVDIQIQNDYIKISGKDKTLYLDYDGNKISNTDNLTETGFPEKAGDYERQQITLEKIYYVKD